VKRFPHAVRQGADMYKRCKRWDACPVEGMGALIAGLSRIEVQQAVHCWALSCVRWYRDLGAGAPTVGAAGWLSSYWKHPVLWQCVGFATGLLSQHSVLSGQGAQCSGLGWQAGGRGLHCWMGAQPHPHCSVLGGRGAHQCPQLLQSEELQQTEKEQQGEGARGGQEDSHTHTSL